jgi:spore coat polysaccharide biosynthesis protein SpsF (cytidylyltransferase family)
MLLRILWSIWINFYIIFYVHCFLPTTKKWKNIRIRIRIDIRILYELFKKIYNEFNVYFFVKINSLNAKNKNINLHSKFYMLVVHNQKKKTKKMTSE